jgi:exopolyphosphatase/guanosine-5'-triphosphate,3'-diphosphate pyrophosphatase
MAGAISRCPVELISGAREARLSALGVISGIHRPDGLVGDLGGGSLELIDIKDHKVGQGVTLPLGGLRLIDETGGSLKKAEKLVEKKLNDVDLSSAKNRVFYAVGGTWRAISRLHMQRKDYPLHVTHGYEIEAREAIDFCKFLQKGDDNAAEALAQVSAERRPLISYGALVLEKILKATKTSHIVMSALGVREGLLFSQLSPQERNADPLLSAARDLSMLHSRSPRHGEELCKWTDVLFSSLDDKETPGEKRLRHAACLLADMTWRGHPDYRGEQSLNIIAHGAFIGIDHPGRVFLALSIYHRHEGISETGLSPRLASLADERTRQRAKLLGLAMRVAYIISASMPGVLPRAPLYARKGKLKLELSGELRDLHSKRVSGRLNRLAKFLNLSALLETRA